jgi:hypothetical protein
MTNMQIRTIIRAAAADRDVKYRITKDGEVHFYGQMPNSNQVGWYLVDQSAENLAARISKGNF